ncbi:MAG: hypothetical protein U1E70_18055 [Acetobacteraceae bacterium]
MVSPPPEKSICPPLEAQSVVALVKVGVLTLNLPPKMLMLAAVMVPSRLVTEAVPI